MTTPSKVGPGTLLAAFPLAAHGSRGQPEKRLPAPRRTLSKSLLALSLAMVAPACASSPEPERAQPVPPSRIFGEKPRATIAPNVFPADLRGAVKISQVQVGLPQGMPPATGSGEAAKACAARMAEILVVGLVGIFEGGGLAVLAAPFACADGVSRTRKLRPIAQALAEANMPAELQRVLEARLSTTDPAHDSTAASLKIEILAYGLALDDRTTIFDESTADESALCTVLEANLVLARDGRELFSDRIIQSHRERSTDLPPPRCATVAEFTAENAALVRQVAAEDSQILGAAIARRIQGHL